MTARLGRTADTTISAESALGVCFGWKTGMHSQSVRPNLKVSDPLIYRVRPSAESVALAVDENRIASVRSSRA